MSQGLEDINSDKIPASSSFCSIGHRGVLCSPHYTPGGDASGSGGDAGAAATSCSV